MKPLRHLTTVRFFFGLGIFFALLLAVGCDWSTDPAPDPQPDPGPTPGPGPSPGPSPSGDWPAEITGPITWLNTDVSGWAATATLNASVSGGTISLPYSKAKAWPSVGGLNANAWAIVNVGGQWYAGTFEYLKYGQQAKPIGVVNGSLGNHFQGEPLNHWRPRSGERIGIMVSGLARSSARNVRERSNVSMITWP